MRDSVYVREKLIVSDWSDLSSLTKTGRKHDRKQLSEMLEEQMKMVFRDTEQLQENSKEYSEKVFEICVKCANNCFQMHRKPWYACILLCDLTYYADSFKL